MAAKVATFAFSGNTLFSILKFMAVVGIGAKILEPILMSLRGMVSVSTAFLVSVSFRRFFTLSTVVGKKKITCVLSLSVLSSF